MLTIEDKVWALNGAGIAVELLTGSGEGETYYIGIRLRTFGKRLPANRMILAAGLTFEEALDEAISKAKAKRWESLDWGSRPWERPTREWAAGQFGL